jgi:uncharacterized membrane protein SpoIIM required for sporulation
VTEKNFIQRREHIWNEFSNLVRGKRSELRKKAVPFVQMFRELTQDLNTAKSCGFDPAIIERLNSLVSEGNQILYAQHRLPLKAALNFTWQTFPKKVRSHWRGILAVTLLFYGISIFFGVLCIRFTDMAEELISAHKLSQIEEMYNPESEHFLKSRDVSGDADMFGFYIYNNISIAFRTFAGGILAGIGSLLILCFNAGFLGIIGGHLINVGYAKNLYSFVIAHSAFELTAIIFCGYSGLLLGYRFFITQGLSRGSSIKRAAQDALPIIAGSTIMLVIAAFIEAFWSSKHQLPFALRITAGAVFWILLLLYFLFAGRKGPQEKNNEAVT